MSILIADSGSTKTDWAWVRPGAKPTYFRTAGLNPYFAGKDFFEEVLHAEVAVRVNDSANLSIYFYGAGCGSSSNCDWVSGRLGMLKPVQVEVAGDLLGAARATLQQRSGVACILGTGANAGFYRDGKLTALAPSLGYVLGDEGAGAWLGGRILQAFLRGELPDQLQKAFVKSYPNANRDEILRHVYRENTPNRYLAQFAKFAAAQRTDDWMHELIIQGIELFFEKYVLPVTGKESGDIGFTGSVAVTFAENIRSIAGKHAYANVIVESSPINGLVKFHGESNL